MHLSILRPAVVLGSTLMLLGCSATDPAAPTTTGPAPSASATGDSTGSFASNSPASPMDQSPITPSTTPAGPGTPASATTPSEDDMQTITLTVGERRIAVQLNDSVAAADLSARLPVTTTFRDYGGQEKIGRLTPPLSTKGDPSGSDPDANELGWYSPDGVLVLYYTDVDYFAGIVRLGSIAPDDMAWLREQPDGFTATFTS